MRTKIRIVVILGPVLLMPAASHDRVGAGDAGRKKAETEALAKLMEVARDSAKETYELSVNGVKVGLHSPIGQAIWSRRWLEADLELAGGSNVKIAKAQQSHVDRITEIEKLSQTLEGTGSVPKGTTDAVRFFRLQAGQQRAKPPQAAKGKIDDATKRILEKRLDLAKSVYGEKLGLFKNNPGNDPIGLDLAGWSRRWLKAELDLKGDKQIDRESAHKAHLERMKFLEKVTAIRAQQGLGRTADAKAGTYYRVEAEIWLLQAKMK